MPRTIPQFDLSHDMLSMAASDTRYHIGAHCHGHYEVLLILNGVREMRIGDRTMRARAGDAVIFQPYEVHEEWSGSPTCSLFALRLKESMLAELGVMFPDCGAYGNIVAVSPMRQVHQLFQRMLEEDAHHDRHSALLLKTYITEFLIILNRSADAGRSTEIAPVDRIRQAIARLRDVAQGPSDHQHLAAAAGMSMTLFRQQFKAQVGLSPKAYEIRCRMDEARRLLRDTELPASEIASRVGYADPLFFYRQFREHTGVTTTQYRDGSRRPTV